MAFSPHAKYTDRVSLEQLPLCQLIFINRIFLALRIQPEEGGNVSIRNISSCKATRCYNVENSLNIHLHILLKVLFYNYFYFNFYLIFFAGLSI
jgi:hypothetical protein